MPPSPGSRSVRCNSSRSSRARARSSNDGTRSRATPSPRSGAPLARPRQRRAHAGGRDRVSLGGRPGGRARLGLRCGRHGRADRDREPARRPAAARRLAARARLRARWPPGAARPHVPPAPRLHRPEDLRALPLPPERPGREHAHHAGRLGLDARAAGRAGALDRPRAGAPRGGVRRLRRARASFPVGGAGAAPARRPNIVWIVLDSWRADTFTPENTPEMWRLGLRSQVFLHHVSGGNSTRNGIFTMFYGLHGSYWQSVLAERSGPVLFARLKELGYRLRILSSSSLTFPEFRRTVFVDLAPDIRDAFSGASADVKDRQLVEALDAFSAEAGPDQPFFAFLFLDSPHAPYHFTPEFTPFRPFAKTVSYRAVDDRQGRALICNRYRDAVFYADHLVGEAVKRLEQHGLLERTIVLVTGDHGEECYEHGYWGHNGAFTPEQIRVPLVLYVPWLAPARHARLTGHQDLPATFLEMLGVENPPADYGSGRSLLRDEADPYEVSCGWDECALVDASGELVFGTQAYKAAGIDVLDPDYRAVADRKEALAARASGRSEPGIPAAPTRRDPAA